MFADAIRPLDRDIPLHIPPRQRLPLLACMDGVEVRIWHIPALDPIIRQ